MKNPITSDDLTPMESRIYKAIVIQGMNFNDLCKRFSIERTTVDAHVNAICQKKQIWGNSRLFALQAQFWKGVVKMANCSDCQAWHDKKCNCAASPFFGEPIKDFKAATNMICTHLIFKEVKDDNSKLPE